MKEKEKKKKRVHNTKFIWLHDISKVRIIKKRKKKEKQIRSSPGRQIYFFNLKKKLLFGYKYMHDDFVRNYFIKTNFKYRYKKS